MAEQKKIQVVLVSRWYKPCHYEIQVAPIGSLAVGFVALGGLAVTATLLVSPAQGIHSYTCITSIFLHKPAYTCVPDYKRVNSCL